MPGGGGGVSQLHLMFFLNNFSKNEAIETKFRLILHQWTHQINISEFGSFSIFSFIFPPVSQKVGSST